MTTSVSVRSALSLALLTLVAPGTGFAKSPLGDVGRPAEIFAPRASENIVQDGIRFDAETGVPRALYRPDYVAAPGDPEAMARSFLADRHELLRLEDPTLSDLVHHHTREGLAGRTVRFRQTVQGLPVLAPDIAVTIDHGNRVLFVMSGYEPGLRLSATTPALSNEEARSVALAYLGVQGGLTYDRTTLAIQPAGKEGRLVWQVKMAPALSPVGDWEVLVDAMSGEIVRAVDNAAYVDGSGYVFDPDPLSQAGASYGTGGFTDGNDATNADLDGARSVVTLPDLTDLGGGTYKLQGPYAVIVDTESPFYGLFTQTSTTFNYNRFDNAFEAANCYFHVDQIMRYINETLGISLAPFQYAGGARFDPHGLSGSDNSHYTPSTGVIAFGEGGVDDAEDADVVIHELGHAIHDWLTAGNLSQVNGLSEGTGDYVCQSYSRSLGQWTPGDPQYQWVFNWDGHNPFWGGRITNYGATYPGGLVGQIHTDGQIWSTCLMRIWDEIGRAKTDAAVYEGLAMTNSGSSQNDAAQAVLNAAGAMGYSASEIGSIVTNFQTTGYTISTGLDYVSHAGVDHCASDPANDNGVWEPGETISLTVTVSSPALARSGVSGTLATTTPGVTIVNATADWPDFGPGSPTANDPPYFTVQIDESVACLSTIDFELTVTSNEGGPFILSFSHSVGASVVPPGLPLSIPDGNLSGVTSTLDVAESFVLTDVNVRVEIQHTWVGDLKIELQSPSGPNIVLLDRPGVPASTYGCSNDNMNVTFDDASGFNPETHCPGTNPWYVGLAAPVQALSAFNGQSAQGTWSLKVSDAVGADVGSIVAWELITTPPIVGTCTPCLQGVDAPVVSTGPAAFGLSQNRPNPFSPSTEIRFQLPAAGRARLDVFDVAGRRIRTLVDAELAAGPHTVVWDGTDADRTSVASGIYFYRLTGGERSEIKRMHLVR